MLFKQRKKEKTKTCNRWSGSFPRGDFELFSMFGWSLKRQRFVTDRGEAWTSIFGRREEAFGGVVGGVMGGVCTLRFFGTWQTALGFFFFFFQTSDYNV